MQIVRPPRQQLRRAPWTKLILANPEVS